jgi:hypothetical protein
LLLEQEKYTSINEIRNQKMHKEKKRVRKGWINGRD